MTIPKYSDLEVFKTVEQINKEILKLQKNLFVLRLKQRIDKTIKPNTLLFIKRQIAQLKFKKATKNILS